MTPRVMTPRVPPRLVTTLGPLLSAAAAAEALAADTEPDDLAQTLWLRLAEDTRAAGPPPDPVRWLRDALRAELRRGETAPRPGGPGPAEAADPLQPDPAELALTAEHHRAVRAAVHRLPGRCARLMTAFLSPRDLTYREIAGELGISQGSLGPERSRCLGCLRRMLAAEVAAPDPWGKER